MAGKTKKEEPTFEESLSRLEEIVGMLERGDAPLERGLELFEEGVALTKQCHGLLKVAEDRVRRFVKEDEDGEIRLELFDDPEGTA